MIWLCVFPTLTVINLALGDWLTTLSPMLRTFVLATVAVPVAIYGLMRLLHKVRVRIMTRTADNSSGRLHERGASPGISRSEPAARIGRPG